MRKSVPSCEDLEKQGPSPRSSPSLSRGPGLKKRRGTRTGTTAGAGTGTRAWTKTGTKAGKGAGTGMGTRAEAWEGL
jgi:hypothetical protein